MSAYTWSIFRLYKPIYYFSKLFGFAPFNLIKKQTSIQSFQYFSIVIQCLYLLKIYFFCIFVAKNYTGNIYQLFLTWFEFVSMGLTQFLNYFNMLIHFKRINKILIQIDQADKYLDKISLCESYDTIKNFRNIYFFFKMILFLSTGFTLVFFSEKFYEYIQFLTFAASGLVTEFQTIFIMYAIGTKLKCLKHILKPQRLTKVLQCFDEYNNIYYHFKNTFQITIFGTYTNAFVLTVHTVLFYVMAATKQGLNVFFVIGWLLFYISTPSIMCGLAVFIDHEVSKKVTAIKICVKSNKKKP